MENLKCMKSPSCPLVIERGNKFRRHRPSVSSVSYVPNVPSVSSVPSVVFIFEFRHGIKSGCRFGRAKGDRRYMFDHGVQVDATLFWRPSALCCRVRPWQVERLRAKDEVELGARDSERQFPWLSSCPRNGR